MKYLVKYCSSFLLLLLVFCTATSCRKEPTFDVVPHIEFRRFEENITTINRVKFHDIGIVVYFQDGDGDLGMPTNNNLPKNFIIKMFVKEVQPNGTSQFVEFPLSDGELGGQFPRISAEDRSEPLEGEIKYILKDLISSDIPGLAGKVAVFDVYIIDRANNRSNIVRTDEITLLP